MTLMRLLYKSLYWYKYCYISAGVRQPPLFLFLCYLIESNTCVYFFNMAFQPAHLLNQMDVYGEATCTFLEIETCMMLSAIIWKLVRQGEFIGFCTYCRMLKRTTVAKTMPSLVLGKIKLVALTII